MNNKYSVGNIRLSQILWTYGPGALIDLPRLSVVTMGIDQWEENDCIQTHEARLLSAVRDVLGSQVNKLRMPPFVEVKDFDSTSANTLVGVPVKPFPRWLRCVKCGLLSELDLGLFEIIENKYRPEKTRFVHKNCTHSSGNNSDAVPARFLLACRNGHLDDFPWHYFVHEGSSDCRGTLRFFESGASMQTENLWVKCDSCSKSRNMAHAFSRAAIDAKLPRCRGRHPHLDNYDDNCDKRARAVLLGATNSWFPITLSALAIPRTHDAVYQLVRDGWEYFKELVSEEQVTLVVKTLKTAGVLSGIDNFSSASILVAIKAVHASESGSYSPKADIKGPEWEVLTASDPPTNWPHFLSKPTSVPDKFKDHISAVLLLERLREVNALLGFTRIEAPYEADHPNERPPIAGLSNAPPTWVPSCPVNGEGIFIRFQEDKVREWEERKSVQDRDRKLIQGHKGWRTSRMLNPSKGYPGARYVLLHTVAHLLIRELSLECGYHAASIRERIYADTKKRYSQAGILLYTAAADSDGTLGGLVDLGKPENLLRLLSQALLRAEVCSSDPLCAEHEPNMDRSLHAASCHACSFLSETSCERGNLYIDRALVVPTLGFSDTAFF